jgi:hypothetical protein
VVPDQRIWSGPNWRLDGILGARFNRPITLYALVASDSNFAVDVFVTHELAEQALREVLFDEPGFAPLLSIEPITPPWLHEHEGSATSRP